MTSRGPVASRIRSRQLRADALRQDYIAICLDALHNACSSFCIFRMTPLKLKLVIFLLYMVTTYVCDWKNAAYAPIKIDLGLSTTDITIMQSVQTIALALTSMLGFVADKFGCRKCCMMVFLLQILALSVLSIAHNFYLILIGLTVVDAAFALVWPSLTTFIGSWFRDNKKERDKAIWMLCLSSRVAGVTSLFVYSGLLHYLKNWRLVTLVVALFPGAMGFFVTVFFVWDNPAARGPKSEKKLDRNIEKSHQRSFLFSRPFQLMLISHTCTKVWRRSDMLLGLFFMDATNFGEKDVPLLVALQPLGFLMGILIQGPTYNSCSTPNSRLRMINQLFSVSTVALVVISFASMWADSALKTVVLGWSVFLASYGSAIQYYIVTEVFIFDFDEKSVGHGISFMDGLAYVFSAIVFIPIGLIADGRFGWHMVWALVAILMVLACIFMNYCFRVFYLDVKKTPSVSSTEDSSACTK